MNPIIWIALIVGLLLTGFIVPKIVNVGSTGVSFKNPFSPAQISITNQTSVNATGAWDWAKSIPLHDFWNMLSSGTKGVIEWLSRGMTMLLSFVFHLFAPNLIVPSWIGWLCVLFIMIGILWWQWENIWEFMHGIIFWIVLLIVVIVVIAIFLIFMGILK